VRSNSNVFMQKTERKLEQIASEIAIKHSLKLNIHWTESFQAN
jgi:metal-dependent amidase/aminoacylase/carboxypeptidase family protein